MSRSPVTQPPKKLNQSVSHPMLETNKELDKMLLLNESAIKPVEQ